MQAYVQGTSEIRNKSNVLSVLYVSQANVSQTKRACYHNFYFTVVEKKTHDYFGFFFLSGAAGNFLCPASKLSYNGLKTGT